MDRRSFLTRVAGAATPFAAGCLGGPGASGTPTPRETARPTATATATATSSASTPSATATPTEDPGPDAVVRLQRRHANPTFVGIQAGETVQWVNDDSFPHELKSTQFHDAAEDWEFGPHRLGSGESVSYTFEQRGQYEYYGILESQDVLCGAVTVGVALGEPLPCE